MNGVAIVEPYLDDPNAAASATAFDVTVPAGRIWVMGDNRNDSADSRAHQSWPGGGSVAVDDVVGRAFLRTWPGDRFGILDRPFDVFADVPPAASAG